MAIKLSLTSCHARDLPRWPVESPPAEQVQVQVRHGLPGSFLAIENQAVAVTNAQMLRQAGRDQVQVAEQLSVGFGNFGVVADYLARNYPHMHRARRVDATKPQPLSLS